MTESRRAGHYDNRHPRDASSVTPGASDPTPTPTNAAPHELTLKALYEAHFDFVWRSVKHLGVADATLDDAVQDVFVVVHRRLHEFAQRSSPRTWLFGIALRVARDYRRARGRRERFLDAFGRKPEPPSISPYEHTVLAEAGRMLRDFLDTLSEEQRAVFILADVEQMTAPEIADALGVNLNTVYSRLRAARAAFNRIAATTVGQSERPRG